MPPSSGLQARALPLTAEFLPNVQLVIIVAPLFELRIAPPDVAAEFSTKRQLARDGLPDMLLRIAPPPPSETEFRINSQYVITGCAYRPQLYIAPPLCMAVLALNMQPLMTG